MHSPTVEDYLKALLSVATHERVETVPMGKLAERVGVTAGTATSMVKSLAARDLVDYRPRQGAALTKGGREAALQVLRRHRLIEYFLAETLGMDWSEIHEEAERLEHAVSERVLERIDTFLGHPRIDPHGDQIPGPGGEMEERRLRTLNTVKAGQSATVAQIRDQNAAFLTFASEQGLRPGSDLTVEGRNPSADALVLRLADREDTLALGRSAAEKILVEPE